MAGVFSTVGKGQKDIKMSIGMAKGASGMNWREPHPRQLVSLAREASLDSIARGA